MTPIGEDTVELHIAEVFEHGLFVDEADLGNAVVRTVHLIDPLGDGRRRVSDRVEITGPAAGRDRPHLGPRISPDFPEMLSALVERAEP
jgi:hypothetical protein